MAAYQSDKEMNRRIVALSFKDEDGHYKDDRFIDACYEVPNEVLALSESILTRKQMMPYVLEHKQELAVWKAVSLPDNWTTFLAQLQMNRVTIRDLTLIKQIIDQDFGQMLEDAIADGYQEQAEGKKIEDEKIQIIEGIRSVTTYNCGNGLGIRIEYL